MKFHSIIALLAIAPTQMHAGHESPTCDSLGIPKSRDCISYCGELGYDSITTQSDVGSPGSYFWVVEGLGETCKCKTSPPGSEYNENSYKIVCHNVPSSKNGKVSNGYVDTTKDTTSIKQTSDKQVESDFDRVGMEQTQDTNGSIGGISSKAVPLAVAGIAVIEIVSAAIY